MTETYSAREPDLVWTLADLGILDRERAQQNEARWWVEWDHLEELWGQAEEAWKALPWLTRLKIGFKDSPVQWKIRWRQQHDPWRQT